MKALLVAAILPISTTALANPTKGWFCDSQPLLKSMLDYKSKGHNDIISADKANKDHKVYNGCAHYMHIKTELVEEKSVFDRGQLLLTRKYITSENETKYQGELTGRILQPLDEERDI